MAGRRFGEATPTGEMCCYTTRERPSAFEVGDDNADGIITEDESG